MSKMSVAIVLTGLFLTALCLAACREPATAIPNTPTATQIPPTWTPLPTNTPLPTSTPTPTPTPTPSPTPTLSPQELLQAATDASSQTSSFRYEMEIYELLSGEGMGTDVELTLFFAGAYQQPDRTQGTMSVSLAGTEVEIELIIIGETSYIKDPETGVWQVQEQTGLPFNPEDFMMDVTDINNLQLLELTEIDGVPAYHITGNALMPLALGEPLGKVEATMLVDYWINQENYLPIKSAATGQINLKEEYAITIDVTVSMRMFDYNQPLEITAPLILVEPN